MSFFNGRAERGDRLVVVQGDIRILGIALVSFDGGPGYTSGLSLRVIEVLSGSFPRGIEELMVNANSWDIYREGDSSIPELEPSSYDELTEAFAIFKGYGGNSWLSAEHDIIYSGPDPEIVTATHKARLETLGWNPDSSLGNFYYFV